MHLKIMLPPYITVQWDSLFLSMRYGDDALEETRAEAVAVL